MLLSYSRQPQTGSHVAQPCVANSGNGICDCATAYLRVSGRSASGNRVLSRIESTIGQKRGPHESPKTRNGWRGGTYHFLSAAQSTRKAMGH
jgi:hypothetical protein